MKKRGFTLIELLAVIVVLAIIALIATPIVMNVIKKVSAGAAERSADNYVKAVETLIATEKLSETPISNGTYTIESDGTIKGNGKTYTVELSGTKPEGGKVTITNGQVDKSNTTIEYTDYEVTFTDGVAEATEKSGAEILCRAIEPVEQWVWDGPSFASKKESVGIKATESNQYADGAVYSCNLGDGDDTKELIFYVLKSTTDTVSLIMEENIGNSPLCENERYNVCGGESAIEYLNSNTTGWKKLFNANGNVELPLEEDIPDDYKPTWLHANLNDNEGPYGYWLLNNNEGQIGNALGFGGERYSTYANSSVGVRPVITILKENMSL